MMQKDNPAVYECPKANGSLHTWKRQGDGAICTKCKLVLNAEHAAEVFYDGTRKEA